MRQGVCGNTANGSWGAATAGDPRKIVLSPFPQMGTMSDFEPGDPIVQPLGPTPYLPTGFRVRHHQGFPNRGLNGASFQSCNWGRVMVGSGLNLMGPRGMKLEDILKGQKDGKPSYGDGVMILASTGNAFHVRGPVTGSAIRLDQWDDNVKSINWVNNGGTARLWVRPANSDFVIDGGNLDFSGRTSIQQKGISQTSTASKNLRGINVSVKAESKTVEIKFQEKEADINYSIVAQPNWNTNDWISEKRVDGFTVEFSALASGNAKIDWQLIR